MGERWQLVALAVEGIAGVFMFAGVTRVPRYTPKSRAGTFAKTRVSVGGDSQQTKREQGEQNNKRLPWVPASNPVEAHPRNNQLNKLASTGP